MYCTDLMNSMLLNPAVNLANYLVISLPSQIAFPMVVLIQHFYMSMFVFQCHIGNDGRVDADETADLKTV